MLASLYFLSGVLDKGLVWKLMKRARESLMRSKSDLSSEQAINNGAGATFRGEVPSTLYNDKTQLAQFSTEEKPSHLVNFLFQFGATFPITSPILNPEPLFYSHSHRPPHGNQGISSPSAHPAIKIFS